MPSDSKRSQQRTPVSTILTPLERSRVDAAAQGLCDALHRESLDEVVSDLRLRGPAWCSYPSRATDLRARVVWRQW